MCQTPLPLSPAAGPGRVRLPAFVRDCRRALVPAVLLAAAPIAALGAQDTSEAASSADNAGVVASMLRAIESGTLEMTAPTTARSGPMWQIRSPDLRSASVVIALGVPRDSVVAVHLTEGDVVVDGEFAFDRMLAWLDAATAMLTATDSVAPAAGMALTPRLLGWQGVSLELQIVGVGSARRFGLVASDSLGVDVIAPELSAQATLALVTQLRALAAFALDRRAPERILYANGSPVFEFQVEKPAIARSGNPPPRYPALLHSQGIEGRVLVQFVVDTSGRADMRTFRVLESTHAAFVPAVREVLPRYRFLPAETEGRKVNMYVQMPFNFAIDRSGPPRPDILRADPDPMRPRIRRLPNGRP